jgi:hypothetical protein
MSPAAWSTRSRYYETPECPMAGKNKRGREVRKPKQTPKPKPAKDGTDISRVMRQAKLPRTK